MAKTKTLGIRVTPVLAGELTQLKGVFDFATFGEMLESLVRLLRHVDEDVCKIDRHPHEWGVQDLATYLAFNGQNSIVCPEGELDRLLWRRLKQRFGEDGVEIIRQLLAKHPSAIS